MAGMGPAPKPAHLRRRTNAPTHSTVVLPRRRVGAIPKLPSGVSTAEAREAWRTWWRDGVATMWTDADRVALTRAIRFYDEWCLGSTRKGLDAELRLTLDGLGLTPKGRLQLRWAYAAGDEQTTSSRSSAGNVTPIASARSKRGKSNDDPRLD